jgi:hypothetical protein
MLVIHLSAPVSVANRVEEVLIVVKRRAQVRFGVVHNDSPDSRRSW